MEIDLQRITTKDELQQHLAQCLAFPDWHGNNWDAFWDCITDLVELPNEIEFIGLDQLCKSLPDDALQLKSCFNDLAREYPNIRCKVSWH